MRKGKYAIDRPRSRGGIRGKWLIAIALVAILGIGVLIYKQFFASNTVEKAVSRMQFDESVSESEKTAITSAITNQSRTYSGSTTASIMTGLTQDNAASVLETYVPVARQYEAVQSVSSESLAQSGVLVPAGTEKLVRDAIAVAIGADATKITETSKTVDKLAASEVAFIPAGQLSTDVKLLKLNGSYYLDSYTSGAVFRQVRFSGGAAAELADLQLNTLPTKESVFKVNMSGVTALTRLMQRKLDAVKDPLYFSAKIGDFMSDADITHVSNEVSFKENCAYSNVLFCSPPAFIETLKDSGVDLVELTGNHNNDNGNIYNTESIKLYQSLGMSTYGGGLNTEEARKPYVADIKGSKVTFIGYNKADGPGSGAIAGATTAGANIYTDEKAQADIAAAKESSQFVIVNIQYAECQAYPSGYVEFPQCDGPIGGQEADFRRMIDYGADMVVGSSAHQPQTYEYYKGKPIYYGLGNMYFEQVQWPGTERGIILTHYFSNGKLLQTKLTPTVYDRNFQTEIMDEAAAVRLLDRLGDARP